MQHTITLCEYMCTLSQGGREEGPSAARGAPSVTGRAEFLGPAVFSGCPQQGMSTHLDGPTRPNHIIAVSYTHLTLPTIYSV